MDTTAFAAAAAAHAALEPVTKFEHFTVIARDARTGDHWNQLVVDRAASKFGPKWTELRTTDGKLIVRTESASEIRVGRYVETAESKQARNDIAKSAAIESAVRNWSPTLPAALEKLAANTSHFEIHNMMQAKAHDNVMAGFVDFALRSIDNGSTWVEVNAEVKKLAADRLIGKARYAANRSTSQISNILDDMELEVLSEVAGGGFTGRGW